LPQAALTRASRAFATHMDLIFMLATFATLKAIRSHCSPTIRLSPDETDNAGYAGGNSALFAGQTQGRRSKSSFAECDVTALL